MATIQVKGIRMLSGWFFVSINHLEKEWAFELHPFEGIWFTPNWVEKPITKMSRKNFWTIWWL
jgi:hypothetical protein